MLYCGKCGIVPVPEDQLPVELPEDVHFSESDGSPLLTNKEFVNTTCPQCSGPARRETDTMDTFVDSAWYFYRYLCPKDDKQPFDSKIINHFFPIDQYIGGAEHAVLHLIYCRFWTKVMRDLGLVNHNEPIQRLFNQGMVYKDGAKMSKSKGNVVPPDEMVERYGCDTARLFEIFAGPPPKDMEWSQAGVEGCHRFLQRLFRLVEKHCGDLQSVEGAPAPQTPGDRKVLRKTHQTIKRVTNDFTTRWHFNTSVAAVMELVNEMYLLEPLEENASAPALKHSLEMATLLISPFAPHVAEELWEMLGHTEPVVDTRWPGFDAALAKEEEYEIVVQINGKVRTRIVVAEGLNDDEIAEQAKAEPRVATQLDGKEIRKTIVVPKKLVNIVIAS
jgi:leucyl-tRNA synthetase